jgi:hypothetical protein
MTAALRILQEVLQKHHFDGKYQRRSFLLFSSLLA